MEKDSEKLPKPTPEEEAQGQRALIILYIVMGIMIVLPFVVYFLKQKMVGN